MTDRIDALVGQWRGERPDLDLATMATVARLLAVAREAEARIRATAAGYGVSVAEGDILFALRRSGAPHRLLPSQLSAALLVASGTLTPRLDRLERRELVRRAANPDDRRSVAVELTPTGLALTDEAVTRHVEVERELLAPLGERDRRSLDRLLGKLLAA